MNLKEQIFKHFREVWFGGNWTSVNLKEVLANVSWQQATTQVNSLNTIAALVFHINYYVSAVTKVFEGSKLDAHDRFSFELPAIRSENDWKKLLEKTFTDAEKLAGFIKKMPEEKLWETFEEEKYGNYYRNLHGITEHTHYHLGQIVLIKNILSSKN